MRLEVFLASLVLCILHTTLAVQTEHSRSRRSILEFGTLIECATGGSWADYSAYGCYCGFGGSGTPVDETDRCCQQHDACYSRSKRGGGCPINDKLFALLGVEVPAIYVQTYEFAVKNCAQPARAKISCKNPKQYPLWRRVALGDTLKCAYSLCECDRISAECFAKHRKTYNKNYLDLSNIVNKQRCGPANFQRLRHN